MLSVLPLVILRIQNAKIRIFNTFYIHYFTYDHTEKIRYIFIAISTYAMRIIKLFREPTPIW